MSFFEYQLADEEFLHWLRGWLQLVNIALGGPLACLSWVRFLKCVLTILTLSGF